MPTRYSTLDWADQLPQPKDSMIVHASNSSAVSPTTPRPSKEGGTRARPIATPPTRPPHKHFSPLNNPSETPRSSRKRLEDIEAGLRQREQDISPTRHPGHSKEPEPSTPYSGAQTIPQPPSPVPTEVDCEVETQPRKTFSFLGLDYSPEPITSTIKDEGQPSTPKKRRLTSPTEGTVIQPAADAVTIGGGLPLTPPQTTRRVAQSDAPRPFSPVTRSRKGKEREGLPPVWSQGQVGTRPLHNPRAVLPTEV